MQLRGDHGEGVGGRLGRVPRLGRETGEPFPGDAEQAGVQDAQAGASRPPVGGVLQKPGEFVRADAVDEYAGGQRRQSGVVRGRLLIEAVAQGGGVEGFAGVPLGNRQIEAGGAVVQGVGGLREQFEGLVVPAEQPDHPAGGLQAVGGVEAVRDAAETSGALKDLRRVPDLQRVTVAVPDAQQVAVQSNPGFVVQVVREDVEIRIGYPQRERSDPPVQLREEAQGGGGEDDLDRLGRRWRRPRLGPRSRLDGAVGGLPGRGGSR
ncbi:hypothetical protein STENM223S_03579 [Streptomyces tendae]